MIHTTTTTKLDHDNPWPGLESYEEDAQYYFFGRESKVEELLNKVLDAPVTVLFGRSGLGKTSLLQAGLFPLMREHDFLPIYVRFEIGPKAAPLTRQLHDSVRDSIQQADLSDAMLPSEEESLWEYLHRNDFELWSRRNYQLTPVIVLDQFEELFTIGEKFPDRVDAFRNDLGDLAENRIPADLAARIKSAEVVAGQFNLRSRNYKLLISLREDYLPHLDEWRRLIPALGRSRMRLLRLREDDALEAVHKPAVDLMTEELARQVVGIIAGADLHPNYDTASTDVVASARRRGAAEVEPALLSLVCSELNEERKRLGRAQFDEQLVEEHGRNTLSNYYSSCVDGLRDTVKEFIEDKLISEKGFRNFYALEDAVPSLLTDDELSRLIDSRLVRIVEYHGAQRIELTHDVLTRAVREHRDVRRAEEEKENEKAALAEAAEHERQSLAHAAEMREAELDRERRAERERRLESEKAASRRLRWLSAGLAVALVAAVVSAVVAWQARQEAQARSREAHVQRLYADSQLMLAEQSPLGSHDVKLMQMLLAAHAIPSTQQAREYELLTTLNGERDVLKVIDLPAVTKGVAFSPDGTLIASGSDDETVRLWNTDGQLVGQSMHHDDKVTSVAFSPEGTRIVSGSDDETVRLWNTDGQLVGQPMHHDDKVTSVAFSPEGTRIVSGSADKTVRLWNTDGQLVGQPMHDDDKVTSVAFSPDGTRIVSGSADNAVRLWTADGKPIGQAMRHDKAPDDAVNSVAFSPDSSRIASASTDSTIRVWDAQTQQQIGEPLRHAGAVNSVAFSPDNARIATGGNDRTIRLWDTETGRLVGLLRGHEAAVTALGYGSDNRHLVSSSGDGTVRLWDTSWQPMFGHDAAAWAGFFDNGRLIGSGSWDKTVRWWKPATGQPIGEPLRIDDADVEVLFPIDENRLLSFGTVDDARLWDARTREPIGEPLRLLQDPDFIVSDSTGSRIAAQLEPGVVQVYMTDTMRPVGRSILPAEEVWTVNFSGDGRILATGGVSGVVELWDTATGARMGKPMNDDGGPVWSIEFSSDEKLLAVGHEDYSLRLWDVRAFQRVGERMVLEDAVATAAAFSPDGRTIASGGDDGTIRLWDVVDQTPLGAPVHVHRESITSLQFSPDGTRLLSASEDQTLQVWPVMPPDPDLLCAKITHNMTRDQWNEMFPPEIDYETVCPGLPESEYSG